MVRPLFAAVLALSLAVGASSPAGALQAEVPVRVLVEELQPAEAREDRIYCDGRAPVDPACAGAFVLTGNFDIVVAVEYWFFGHMVIRGETATGSVTVWCEQTFAALDCDVEHEGQFVEGQTFTLTGLVPGMSRSVPGTAYWRIRVP